MEHIACPYCSANEPVLWAKENGYEAQKCTRCGLVYVSPRPPLATIDQAVQEGLHQSEEGKLDSVGFLHYRNSKVRFFRKRLDQLFPNGEIADRPIAWLDVGCGFGELIAAVQTIAAPGSKVQGIDPCEPKVRIAQKKGLDVTARLLGDIHDQYDVLSLINVFSHLPDPRSFLHEVAQRLTDDGELLIVTGNGADVAAEQYPGPLLLPDHLIFVSENILRGFLEQSGFAVVSVSRYHHFFRDPRPLHVAKNMAKRLLGRPTVNWHNDGPFRSLWVRARRST